MRGRGGSPERTAKGLNHLIGSNVLTKVFGTSNERAVKRLLPTVQVINALEPQMLALNDEQLRAKTTEFRARIAKALEGITEEDARIAAEKQARKAARRSTAESDSPQEDFSTHELADGLVGLDPSRR